MKRHLWLTMVTCLAYCLDQELWKAIDYLKEQVRVLKEQQERDKRILLDNHQRMRLAECALGRKKPHSSSVPGPMTHDASPMPRHLRQRF
jgi:hypothetical protein